ncbi:ATG11 [Candida margitis]|uniref:ATG11 n=1 Tax=Candida margitis TaxID=1775924 RepID=UPI002227BF40|nr:ATG11 [Candida margitis]KAI5970078.1 ATG11 [Candida margitis]
MSDISYLTVYNAHSGSFIKIPKPIRFLTLAEFKNYLSQSFSIENLDDLFLLSSFGMKVNYNTINDISEVFVYDKRLFVQELDQQLLNSYVSNSSKDDISPPQQSSLVDNRQSYSRDITSRIKVHQAWARALLQESNSLESRCMSLIQQINTIFKSLTALFQFATSFTTEVEKSFNHHYNYINLISFKTLHKSWKESYKNLQHLPVVIIKDKRVKLVDFLDYESLNAAATYLAKQLPLITRRLAELNDEAKVMKQDRAKVDELIEQSRKESIERFKDTNFNELMRTVRSKAQKIANDFSSVPRGQFEQIYNQHKSVTSVELKHATDELYKYYSSLKRFREQITKDGPKIFSLIANLQLKTVNLKAGIKSLMEDEAAADQNSMINHKTIQDVKRCEDLLSLTIDIPLLFGFALIEKRRQFEWYDFYSKGVVHNFSEQVTSIGEHERAFREMWNKKMGTFLNYIKSDNFVGILPNVDITLVGNQDKIQNFFILRGVDIDRDDITNYISLLETWHVNTNFPSILRKNLHDMKQSTNNMKRVTKLISSLGSFSESHADKMGNSSSKEQLDTPDFDLNVVNGLKSRIKKLESLLHQQQYKNITSWPVFRNGNYSDNRMSMIIDTKQPFSAPVANSDPTKLLQKRTPSKESIASNQSQALDSSVVDKHLDNIKLKRVNTELAAENEHLRREQDTKDKTILQLQQEMEKLEANHAKEVGDLQSKVSSSEEELRLYKLENKLELKEFESLGRKLEAKDQTIAQLGNKISTLEQQQASHDQEISSLGETITILRGELNDATRMKNDLLSNMSSKESEFVQERTTNQSELAKVKSKLDEVNEDYENLMELTQVKQQKHDQLIVELNAIISSIMGKLKITSERFFDTFIEICCILESMGLLLIKEDDTFKIKRVKGLKSKKSTANLEDDVSLVSVAATPTSKVIENIESSMKWTDEISLSPYQPPESPSDDNEIVNVDKYNEESEKLIAKFNDIFGDDTKPSHFDSFLNIISFKDNIQLADENSTSTRFFLNAISKRFKDVEGFAKRQTKDNKLKDQEIRKLMSRNKHKISISSFQENDLLLFLPTRIDNATGNSNESIQPWAAFNVAAPHYFLNTSNLNLNGKEWLIGRVQSITEHKVLPEQTNSLEHNPFQLSSGVTWYMVQVIEDR